MQPTLRVGRAIVYFNSRMWPDTRVELVHFRCNFSAMTPFPTDRIHWLGVRFQDPAGRVFECDGEYYRAIYPDSVAHIRDLFENGVVQPLIERGLLVPTQLTPHMLSGFGLVLKHRSAPFALRPQEWVRPALRDAAQTFLDLNLALLPHGLGTMDAHLANFAQFDACRPTWLDFGSISPLTKAATALTEFRTVLGNPLQLFARDAALARPVHALLRGGGISDTELAALGGNPGPPLKHSSGIFGRFRKTPTLPELREQLLHSERERLPASFPAPQTTWADYRTEDTLPANYDDLTGRKRAILDIIKRLQPKRVADLASNSGTFTFLAARHGAAVLALDFDENALDLLYTTARATSIPLQVTCGLSDLTKPREATADVDLAIALAVTHHLALGQRYPFSYIIERLAAFTKDALLVEFMPNGLGGAAGPSPSPLPEWYSEALFLTALRERFSSVEVVNYSRDPSHSLRTLILARGVTA